VISLRHPADYSAEEGCRFEAHFEKNRGFYGAEAQSFEAKYETREGVGTWTRRTIVDAERARVVGAIKDGMSNREAAEQFGWQPLQGRAAAEKGGRDGRVECNRWSSDGILGTAASLPRCLGRRGARQ
jgi:hypothetical protein